MLLSTSYPLINSPSKPCGCTARPIALQGGLGGSCRSPLIDNVRLRISSDVSLPMLTSWMTFNLISPLIWTAFVQTCEFVRLKLLYLDRICSSAMTRKGSTKVKTGGYHITASSLNGRVADCFIFPGCFTCK